MSRAAVQEWGQQRCSQRRNRRLPARRGAGVQPGKLQPRHRLLHGCRRPGVDTATPSGAGTEAPWISPRSRRDGNVLRELTPQNRLRALATGGDPVARSHELETKRVFNRRHRDCSKKGPAARSEAPGIRGTVEARLHKVLTYEDQAPRKAQRLPADAGDDRGRNPRRRGCRRSGRSRGTAFEYDWTLRQPTKATVDPGEGPIWRSRSISVYDDETGLPDRSSASPPTPKAKAPARRRRSTTGQRGRRMRRLPPVREPSLQDDAGRPTRHRRPPELLVTKYPPTTASASRRSPRKPGRWRRT